MTNEPEFGAFERTWRRKRAAMIAAAVRRHDWSGALLLYSSTERHAALAQWWLDGRLTDDELREVLREWWTATDLVSRGGWQRVVLLMFRHAAPVMDAELPPGDPLRIYRGQGASVPPGLSWTLDPEQARLFAFERRGHARDPIVLTGTIDRKSVLGYFTDRQEAEIVCDPADVRLDAPEAGS